MLLESIICEDNMLHYYRDYNRERYVLQQRQRERDYNREVCITTKREITTERGMQWQRHREGRGG